MKTIKITLLTGLLVASCVWAPEPQELGARYDAIYSGVAWYDQNNNEVNAHGACIVQEGNRFYLFGEHKSDTSNAFTGFACYSSPDLMNWEFERVVLPVQPDGLLGPNRVGERVKVMKCPATGEYVLYMHADDMGYYDPHIGYATADSINGDYEFQGALMLHGEPIKKWDMGTYQEPDGTGYLLTHEGFIYELADDYKSVKRIVVSDVARGGESPAMFRKNGVYFWLFSNKTSWERNDNYYMTATSIEGPWTRRGLFAPEGTLTWNSQCSFVFPLISGKDTLHIYMGDRWSFPRQGSAATHVWQPIVVNKDEMSLPTYQPSWRVDVHRASWTKVSYDLKKPKLNGALSGDWEEHNEIIRSSEKGATSTYVFTGRQTTLIGTSNNVGGYARVVLKNYKGKVILSTIVDFYSKYEVTDVKFQSPLMPESIYALTVEVMGEHGVWTDKSKTIYGSTDNYVTINKVGVR